MDNPIRRWREGKQPEAPTDKVEIVTQQQMVPLDLAHSQNPLRVERFGALLSSDFLACETAKVRAIRSLPVHIVKREDNGRIPTDDIPWRGCSTVPTH